MGRTGRVDFIHILLYIQLHGKSKEKGGKTHGAKGIVIEGPKGHLACLEDSGGQGRDNDERDRRASHPEVFAREGGEVMPLEKTGVPGIYKVCGKKGKVKYRLYITVQVPDPISPAGFRWKLKGKTFAKYQEAVD